MWMNKGRLDDARTSFDNRSTPCRDLRAGAGHLAEVEADWGTESALTRLRSLRRAPRMILITLSNSRAFSGTPGCSNSALVPAGRRAL